MKAARETSLCELDLSVRTLKCLKAADIYTFGDLLDFGDLDNLLKFRHIGNRTITELKELVAEQNSI